MTLYRNDRIQRIVQDEGAQLVAMSLRAQTRDYDVAARFGGDEFCVLLPETNLQGALVVAERIRADVEASGNGAGIDVTVSIGAVVFPGDSKTAVEIPTGQSQQRLKAIAKPELRWDEDDKTALVPVGAIIPAEAYRDAEPRLTSVSSTEPASEEVLPAATARPDEPLIDVLNLHEWQRSPERPVDDIAHVDVSGAPARHAARGLQTEQTTADDDGPPGEAVARPRVLELGEVLHPVRVEVHRAVVEEREDLDGISIDIRRYAARDGNFPDAGFFGGANQLCTLTIRVDEVAHVGLQIFRRDVTVQLPCRRDPVSPPAHRGGGRKGARRGRGCR